MGRSSPYLVTIYAYCGVGRASARSDEPLPPRAKRMSRPARLHLRNVYSTNAKVVFEVDDNRRQFVCGLLSVCGNDQPVFVGNRNHWQRPVRVLALDDRLERRFILSIAILGEKQDALTLYHRAISQQAGRGEADFAGGDRSEVYLAARCRLRSLYGASSSRRGLVSWRAGTFAEHLLQRIAILAQKPHQSSIPQSAHHGQGTSAACAVV